MGPYFLIKTPESASLISRVAEEADRGCVLLDTCPTIAALLFRNIGCAHCSVLHGHLRWHLALGYGTLGACTWAQHLNFCSGWWRPELMNSAAPEQFGHPPSMGLGSVAITVGSRAIWVFCSIRDLLWSCQLQTRTHIHWHISNCCRPPRRQRQAPSAVLCVTGLLIVPCCCNASVSVSCRSSVYLPAPSKCLKYNLKWCWAPQFRHWISHFYFWSLVLLPVKSSAGAKLCSLLM